MKIKKNDLVSWKWSGSTAEGRILQATKARVTKKIKGTPVTRKGTPEDPAIEIKQQNGNRVLKLGHEIKKVR